MKIKKSTYQGEYLPVHYNPAFPKKIRFFTVFSVELLNIISNFEHSFLYFFILVMNTKRGEKNEKY